MEWTGGAAVVQEWDLSVRRRRVPMETAPPQVWFATPLYGWPSIMLLSRVVILGPSTAAAVLEGGDCVCCTVVFAVAVYPGAVVQGARNGS